MQIKFHISLHPNIQRIYFLLDFFCYCVNKYGNITGPLPVYTINLLLNHYLNTL